MQYSVLFCFRSRAFLRPFGVFVGTVSSKILKVFRFSRITRSGFRGVDNTLGGIVALEVLITHLEELWSGHRGVDNTLGGIVAGGLSSALRPSRSANNL